MAAAFLAFFAASFSALAASTLALRTAAFRSLISFLIFILAASFLFFSSSVALSFFSAYSLACLMRSRFSSSVSLSKGIQTSESLNCRLEAISLNFLFFRDCLTADFDALNFFMNSLQYSSMPAATTASPATASLITSLSLEARSSWHLLMSFCKSTCPMLCRLFLNALETSNSGKRSPTYISTAVIGTKCSPPPPPPPLSSSTLIRACNLEGGSLALLIVGNA
mmetsp:Transcript_32481/g.63485  ORF Transcript_32481/g.63485 Transcript_32481/m.63485 type:complete len:224 (-) Transcript_32481:120-791(-)